MIGLYLFPKRGKNFLVIYCIEVPDAKPRVDISDTLIVLSPKIDFPNLKRFPTPFNTQYSEERHHKW